MTDSATTKPTTAPPPSPPASPPPSASMAAAPATRSWLHRLADHNPFYLLSGVCLLLGCFLISSALGTEREWVVGLLLGLLATVWLYELIVLGLGIYLARSLGLRRDAIYLLALASVLLVDGTLIYNELMMLAPRIGAAVGVVAFVLAVVKVGVLARLLGMSLSARAWALLCVSLAVLLILPGVVRSLGQNELLSSGWMYGGWWIIAALLAAHAIEALRKGAAGRDAKGDPAVQRFVRRALLVLPWVSVIGHMLALHYVFEQPLLADHLGPLLLGAMVYLLGQMGPEAGRHGRAVVAALLGLGAIALSLPAAGELQWTMPAAGDWPVGSLRVMLVVTGVAWLVAAVMVRGWWLTALSALAFVLAWAGHTTAAIRERVGTWGEWSVDTGRNLLPETQLQWGLAILVLAFVLLAVGAGVSLLGSRRRTPGE